MAAEKKNAADRLPPCAIEAEQGLLACLFMDPLGCLENARKQIESEAWFYDLRHQLIWRSIIALNDACISIDITTVAQRLKDFGHLGDAGGLEYLVGLPDMSPSATHLESYAQIMKEKLMARRMLAVCSTACANIHDYEGSVDSMIDRVRVEFEAIDLMRQNDPNTVTRVRPPYDYAEEHFNHWFGSMAGTPGLELDMFGLPWRVRESELTLVMGENGAGKSTFFLYLILQLLAHPESKVFIASMEVRPEVTLKMLASQLLGTTTLANTPANHRLVKRAIDWLQERVLIYDFLGIVHWRTLMSAMDFASAKKGVNIVLIDSLMRLGIPDDDYSQQGECMKFLANYSLKHRAHTFIVNHLNKSDRDTKSRNRGSGQIADNAFNILSIARNEKKWGKIDDLKGLLESKVISQADYDAQVSPLLGDWDTYVQLHKQRWSGTRQNGSKRLWFHADSLQYATHANPRPINWLEKWEHHAPRKTLRIQQNQPAA